MIPMFADFCSNFIQFEMHVVSARCVAAIKLDIIIDAATIFQSGAKLKCDYISPSLLKLYKPQSGFQHTTGEVSLILRFKHLPVSFSRLSGLGSN